MRNSVRIVRLLPDVCGRTLYRLVLPRQVFVVQHDAHDVPRWADVDSWQLHKWQLHARLVCLGSAKPEQVQLVQRADAAESAMQLVPLVQFGRD